MPGQTNLAVVKESSAVLRAENVLFRVVREGSLPVIGVHLLMLNDCSLEVTCVATAPTLELVGTALVPRSDTEFLVKSRRTS